MVYNPFAGLWASVDQTSYNQLARNRATVGASELDHFTPVANAEVHAELAVDALRTALIVPLYQSRLILELPRVGPPAAEEFFDSWNRPPPAL